MANEPIAAPSRDTVERATKMVERLGVPTKITTPPSTQYLMRYIITVFLLFAAWVARRRIIAKRCA